MCSSKSVKQATKSTGESLVRNVSIRTTTKYGTRFRDSKGAVRPIDDFVKEQKEATKKFVDVEDRGQFQYASQTTGDIVQTEDIKNRLKAKESTLNVTTVGGPGNASSMTSYTVPAELRIKRNWSVKGPGGLSIPSMNIDQPTQFARTDQSARKPNVRVVNGKLMFG
jgi:hypothetical protein